MSSLHITTDVETTPVVLVSRGDRHEWVQPGEIDRLLAAVGEAEQTGTGTIPLGNLALDRHDIEKIRDTAIRSIR